MEFWIGYVVLGIIVFISGLIVPDEYKNIIIKSYLFIIWCVGSFRDSIGTDYTAYVILFDRYSTFEAEEIFGQYHEPIYILLCMMLNEFGFSSQMFFLISNTIILLGYYKGVKYYIHEKNFILFSLLIFFLFASGGGYYQTWNGIRQAVAVAILFIGSRYIVQRNFIKFIMTLLIAIGFHYSSLLFLPMYWCVNLYWKRKYVFTTLFFAILATITGVSEKIVFSMLNILSSTDSKYQSLLSLVQVGGDASFSQATIFVVLIFVLIVGNLKIYFTPKINFVYNCSCLYIIYRVLVSFAGEGGSFEWLIHRPESFFIVYFFVFIAYFAESLCKKGNGIGVTMLFMFTIIILLSFSFIRGKMITNDNLAARASLYESHGNIDYKMNFKILK